MNRLRRRKVRASAGYFVFLTILIISFQNCTGNNFKTQPTLAENNIASSSATGDPSDCTMASTFEWTVNGLHCSGTGFVLLAGNTKRIENIISSYTGFIEFTCVKGQLVESTKDCSVVSVPPLVTPLPNAQPVLTPLPSSNPVPTPHSAPAPVPNPIILPAPVPAPAPVTDLNCQVAGTSVPPGMFSVESGYRVSSVVIGNPGPTSCQQVRDAYQGICDGQTGIPSYTRQPAFASCVESYTGPCPVTGLETPIVFGNPASALCPVNLNQALASGSLPPRDGSRGVLVNSQALVTDAKPGNGIGCLICRSDKVILSTNPAVDCPQATLPQELNTCKPVTCTIPANYSWENCFAGNSVLTLNWNQETTLLSSQPTGYSGAITIKCDQLNDNFTVKEGSKSCQTLAAANKYQYLTLSYPNRVQPVTIREGQALEAPVVTLNDCVTGTTNCVQLAVSNDELNWSFSKRPPGIEQDLVATICNDLNCSARGALTTQINASTVLPAGAQILIYGSIKGGNSPLARYSGLGGSFFINVLDAQ